MFKTRQLRSSKSPRAFYWTSRWPWNVQSRWLSTIASEDRSIETVEVPCRSNGSIKLNIFPPWTGTTFSKTILFLRSGPVLKNCEQLDREVVSLLRASSNTTIVQLNYRDFKYPNPIHDVLAGYDWVKTRMLEKGMFQVKIGVVGQLVGGSLGAMLALTESRARGTSIGAAVLNSPIVDWVVPDREKLEVAAAEELENAIAVKETGKRRRRKKKKLVGTSWTQHMDSDVLSAKIILTARNSLFKTADGYFDPFASPINFFRTSGCTTPIENGNESTFLTRKSPKVFPPSDSKLVFPRMRISVGEKSLLFSQVEEFVERLEKSQARKESKEGSAIEDHNQEPFSLTTLPSKGLWGCEDWDWKSDVDKAAKWLDSSISQSD